METVNDKKLEYGFESKDFAIENELTVTITLKEYRELIKNWATCEEKIQKANSERYEKSRENDKLKEENTRLKSEIYEMRKRLDVKPEDTAQDEEGDY